MTWIVDNDGMAAFLAQVDGFHDAVIRECVLRARGFVDREYWLHGDGEPFDADVLLQTQSAQVAAVLLGFEGVSHFCIRNPRDLRPSGRVENGVVHFSFSSLGGGEAQIVAASMGYQIMDGSYLGNGWTLCRSPDPAKSHGQGPDQEGPARE